MKYFLTGATGFVGGRVAQHLRAAGHQVITLVRNPAKATHLAAAGMRLATGDVTDKESMRAPMTGCDGVFHVAGWYKVGVQDKTPGAAVNIEGTRNVLELMKELGIAKGVYTSTLAVNSNTHSKLVDECYHFNGIHLSEYDRTKAGAHAIATEFIQGGLPLVIVQPGMIYGPGDLGPSHDLFVQFLTRTLPLMPQKTALSWAHVDDIAHGHLLAMEKGKIGENYFLAGPVHSIIETLRLAEQISNVSVPAIQAPPQMLQFLSKIMSVVEKVMPVSVTYSSEYLRVAAGTTYIGSNAKARQALGWSPRPLADGLTETIHSEMKSLGIS